MIEIIIELSLFIIFFIVVYINKSYEYILIKILCILLINNFIKKCH